ncbi:hypothetical protein [Luteibacter sp.]|nr:hypothetical protein [Luteibacter sp.]MDQ8050721.1 hypothetical protein [Luteibacter sp.]
MRERITDLENRGVYFLIALALVLGSMLFLGIVAILVENLP